MKRAFLLAAIVLFATAVPAPAGMQTLEDEAMADVQASMGASISLRDARAVSGTWGYQDSNGVQYNFGSYGANGNRGYLFFTSVYFSDSGGTSGNINLWNMNLDIGAQGSTEIFLIGFPSIDGRITISDFRIGNCGDYNAQAGQIAPWNTTHYWNTWPTQGGSPLYSIYMEDIEFVEGSGIIMWGHDN